MHAMLPLRAIRYDPRMEQRPPSTDERTVTHDGGSARSAAVQVLVFGDGWSTLHDFEPGTRELVIGREDDCAIRVEERSVSRRHAVLVLGPPATIRDLGSANGVEVDGVRLPRGGAATLRSGARIRLGGVSVAVYGGAAASAEEADDVLDPNDPMVEVHRLCDRVASSDLPVLLLGETGTGKEILATRIHERSRRAGGPFVRVNAATVPESLAESQLFGHERGAFTGALQAKEGLVSAANGGTLLLDEVADLSPAVQTKLLRVVETGAMMRVGSTTETFADVRYIAATSRDVEKLVTDGALRSDLVYRLAGVTVYVPPLRERPMAIVPLARRLLAAVSGGRATLSKGAERALVLHPWPGNVRELKGAIHRASVLAGDGTIEASHLALGALRFGASRGAVTEPPDRPEPGDSLGDTTRLRDDVSALEKERILAALAACGGNQTRASEMLGISRRTLGAKLDRIDYVRPRKPRG
jgi:two-component system, NtrC family, response regulator AtoC